MNRGLFLFGPVIAIRSKSWLFDLEIYAQWNPEDEERRYDRRGLSNSLC